MEKGYIQQFIEWIIHNGGFYFLLFVIFAETGLFIGFFLPGDSLLFAAGFYIKDLALQFYGVHYSIIIIMVILASLLGNMVGFWFGYKAGPMMYERKETWLFRKKHLLRAKNFYDQYGKATIFLAKFLPIIRTFAPIVAGIVKMNRKTFIFYNVLGSLCWVSTMMLGGLFLEDWVKSKFHFDLKQHIEGITIAIVLVTTLPVLYKLFFAKDKPANINSTNSL
ncbi:MAG: DedA family protein [Flavisolibacter sp.]